MQISTLVVNETSPAATLETVVANLSGRVRREKLHGRSYLVAPMTMLVPGVLNGSEGPILYGDEDVGRNPTDWNHMPIVVVHPVNNAGKPVSARDPEILEKQGVGYVFRSAHNKALGAEAWFDEEVTRKVDVRIINDLEANKPLELSTGLFVDKEPAPANAIHNGVAYKYIARNLKPDHLAILPDGVGACSRKDGCGVLANEGEDSLLKRLVDGLSNIFVRKPTNNTGDDTMPLSAAQRKGYVDNLIANCDCGKGEQATANGIWTEADRKTLEALDDTGLMRLDENRKRMAVNERAAATLRKGIEQDGLVVTMNEQGALIVNKKNDGLFDAVPSDVTANDRIEVVVVDNVRKFKVTRGTPTPPPLPTANKGAPDFSQMTEEQFMAILPPKLRTALNNVTANDGREKQELIDNIKGHPNNSFSPAELAEMTVPQLRNVANLAGIVRHNYAVNGGPPPIVDNDSDDLLIPPTVNFEDEADRLKPQLRQAAAAV